LAAFCLTAGCSKSEDKGQGKGSPAPAPVPAETKTAEPPKVEAKAPEGPTGSIKGVVTITGETPEMPLLKRGSDPACDTGEMRAETILVGEEGGLANVVVRIKPGSVPGWVPDTPVIVDQKDCMYRPRVQGGVRGQKVEVRNDDPTTHNVHARHLPLGRRQGVETIMNRAQPSGVSMSFELGEEPVAKLKCDYHGWMQGYVVVSDNPYFGVSSPSGAFEVKDVPVGKHSIELWHEFYGLKTAEVTVEENGTATLDYSYDAVKDDPMAPAEASK
jgi:plastocyanin